MAVTGDKRAAEALLGLITEFNAQIASAEDPTTATQSQQKQPKPEPD